MHLTFGTIQCKGTVQEIPSCKLRYCIFLVLTRIPTLGYERKAKTICTAIYTFVWKHAVVSMWVWASKPNHWWGRVSVLVGTLPIRKNRRAKIPKEMCLMTQLRISKSHAPFFNIQAQPNWTKSWRETAIFKRTWEGLPVFSCLGQCSNTTW